MINILKRVAQETIYPPEIIALISSSIQYSIFFRVSSSLVFNLSGYFIFFFMHTIKSGNTGLLIFREVFS
jgi:hypothetical protein